MPALPFALLTSKTRWGFDKNVTKLDCHSL